MHCRSYWQENGPVVYEMLDYDVQNKKWVGRSLIVAEKLIVKKDDCSIVVWWLMSRHDLLALYVNLVIDEANLASYRRL